MAANQYVTATFDGTQDTIAVSWANLGGTQLVFHGVSTTDGSSMGADLISVTTTGATVVPYARFSGKVVLEIVTQ